MTSSITGYRLTVHRGARAGLVREYLPANRTRARRDRQGAMSIHTKAALTVTILLNVAVCTMAFIAVDRNELPTLAVILVPYCMAGYALSIASYALDLIGKVRP